MSGDNVQLTLEDGLAYLCRPTVGNFYAFVINSLERVITRSIPTFGVMPHGTRYALAVNPDFQGTLSFSELVMILEHEILHIILNHAPRAWDMWKLCEDETSRRYFMLAKPIAADCAVNEILRRNHSAHVLKVGSAILPEYYEMPREKTYEVYMALLMIKLRKMCPNPERIIRKVLKKLQQQIEAAGGAKPGSILAQIQAELKGDGEGESQGQSPGEASGKPSDGDGEQGGGQGGDKPSKQSQNDAGDNPSSGSGDAPENAGKNPAKDPQTSNERLEEQLVNDLAKAISEHLQEYLEDVTDPAKSKHLENSGRDTVREATRTYKKSRGTLPSNIQELVDAFLEPPTVPWTDLFKSLVQSFERSRPIRGMRRVSKMRAALQLFLKQKMPALRQLSLFPGTERDVKYRVVYIIDTSGSMSHDDMAAGLAQLKHVQKAASDMEILVLYVDAGVARAYHIGPDDELDLHMVGRGGTDFDPGFVYIVENKIEVDLVCYATDGYAPAPKTKVDCPVIWLITATGKPIMPNVPGHITLQMRAYGAGEQP